MIVGVEPKLLIGGVAWQTDNTDTIRASLDCLRAAVFTVEMDRRLCRCSVRIRSHHIYEVLQPWNKLARFGYRLNQQRRLADGNGLAARFVMSRRVPHSGFNNDSRSALAPGTAGEVCRECEVKFVFAFRIGVTFG